MASTAQVLIHPMIDEIQRHFGKDVVDLLKETNESHLMDKYKCRRSRLSTGFVCAGRWKGKKASRRSR